MGKLIDLTGQTFGKWYVLGRDWARKSGPVYWLCKCSCGNPEVKSIQGQSLREGTSKSCKKCNQYTMIGQKFNHLTVLEVDLGYKQINHIKDDSHTYYKCMCDCPEHRIVTVEGSKLRRGKVKSCGHLCVEWGKNTAKDITNQVFEYAKALYPTEKRQSTHIVWHCVCLRDGNEFEATMHNLQRGSVKSCGCLNSLGEANIRKILQENNIKYEKQKSFEDLISDAGGYYRYDFYLSEYNRLIEFDGIQHFQYTDSGWNTKEEFKKRQQSDKAKNEYALSHNIPLIRIPYWERDNITLEMLLGDKYLIAGIGDAGEERIIFQKEETAHE